MLDRITSLESKLELEQSALQDARFANDMSQMRLKEVEGTLEDERVNGKQLADKVREIKQTTSSLRCALDEEQRKATILGEQLRRYMYIMARAHMHTHTLTRAHTHTYTYTHNSYMTLIWVPEMHGRKYPN